MAASLSKGSPLNGSCHEYNSLRTSRYSTRFGQQQQHPKCIIELEKVIGNTVTGSNGFDSVPEGLFAVCAGSTAAVSRFSDEEIKQSVFRAPSRTTSEPLSIDATIGTPSRTRGRQHPRASILPNGILTPDTKDSPSKGAVLKKPKGTSCLALSPNGQFLAVGESGYSPRILLFSLSNTDGPISIASEHVSGVQNLCFSPNSKWLCSVGDIYDGYVYIWSISVKGVLKLSASSKCTSTIYSTRWIGDSSIITAGVRHLKIWRPNTSQELSPSKSTYPPRTRLRQDSPVPVSPGPKSLSGRNVLLNELLESTFTSVCSIGESKALVGSDLGDLSIVNVERGTQKLESIANLGCSIRCMSIDQKRGMGYIATSKAIHYCYLKDLGPGAQIFLFCQAVDPIALGLFGTSLFWIDECSYITKKNLSITNGSDRIESSVSEESSFPAHSQAINGSFMLSHLQHIYNDPRLPEAQNLTSFDKTGSIITWTAAGTVHLERKIDLAQLTHIGEEPNELRVVKWNDKLHINVCGDKYGFLYLYSSDWCLLDQVLAHTGEVNDIILLETNDSRSTTVVSCGRDRIIQVFQANEKLELVQTIEQHNGSVNKLEMVIQDDVTLLLSLSSDRTIIAHKLVDLAGSQAFMCVKILTLKSTPLACSLDVMNPSILAVTTTDKQIQLFQLKSGMLESTIRIMDEDDHIIMQDLVLRSINVDGKATRVALGYSNSDRALRLHNGQTGEVLCKASGHSEAITSMRVLEETTENGWLVMKLITTSLDATLMFWKVSCYIGTERADNRNGNNTQQTPLRKVLSRSQLASFAASMDSGDWSPLPSPTREYSPFRTASPDRLRRRTSITNLLKDPSTPVLSPNLRQTRQFELSPSPDIPTTARRRTVLARSESAESQPLSPTDLTQSSTQIINNLRSLRIALRSNANIDVGIRAELKLELETTLDALTRYGVKDDSSQDLSYFSAVDSLQNMTIIEEK